MAVVTQAAVARVKWLAAPTSGAWLSAACARPDLLLIDHAHCERKAAGGALQLMFRYPSDVALAQVLSPLAREELEHFELVLQLLERRGIALRPLPAPAYGAALAKAVRRDEPARLLDSLLVAGLIEARSHERMARLACVVRRAAGQRSAPLRPVLGAGRRALRPRAHHGAATGAGGGGNRGIGRGLREP